MKQYILLLITLISVNFAIAQPHLRFSENKGQWSKNILYKADLFGGFVYIENQSIQYIFYDTEVYSKKYAHKHEGASEFELTEDSIYVSKIDEEHNHSHDSLPSSFNAHSYRLKFINSNPNATISGLNQFEGVENYYIGNDPTKWATGILSYKAVIYNNLYPNIDLKIYQRNGTAKYDFIVHPGGNPNDIELEYSGIDNISQDQRGIILRTSFSEIVEGNPFAYQFNKKTGERDTIIVQYELKGNKFSYKVKKYNKKQTLIIDPELIFSTYSGSLADNWGFTATYDADTNAYSGGIVDGFGYRITEGAFQINFNGPDASDHHGWDIGIMKYTKDGKRIYGTYIGGNETELPHSMVVNSKNELIIFGTTGSDNFPMHSGSYDNSFNGGYNTEIIYDGTYTAIGFENGSDIFVLKLSETGATLLGSTFFGGSHSDGINLNMMNNYGDWARGEVAVDDADNIYIGTVTLSDDIIIKNGFQSSLNGGQEGILASFNSSLSELRWSSYIGGTDDDGIFSIDVDSDRKLYFTGATTSSNFPVTSGVFSENYQGQTDAVIGRVSQNGSLLEASTFFGSPEMDKSFFIRVDEFQNPTIFGQTQANGKTLIKNAGYYTEGAGQFVSSFSNDLTTLNWSTTFGTPDGRINISPSAFAVDICNRIYLSGGGLQHKTGPFTDIQWQYDPITARYNASSFTADYGTFGMETTPNASQSYTDGQDFYFMVLGKNAATLDYATFFGEQLKLYTYNGSNLYRECYSGFDHVDGGTSRFDPRGNIFQSVCASCGGCNDLPKNKDQDVWSEINESTNCNNAVVRFWIGFGFLEAGFTFAEHECNSKIVRFKNTSLVNSSLGLSYKWDFGDGSTSTDENPTHEFPATGEYSITLIVNDPQSCDISDTVVQKIKILPDNQIGYLDTIHICYGESVEIGREYHSGATYFWEPNYNISNTGIANPAVYPLKDTTYTLHVSTIDCNKDWKQTIIVHNNFINIDSIVTSPNTICSEQDIEITVYADDEIASYIWSSNAFFTNYLTSSIENRTLKFHITQDTTLYLKLKGKYCDTEVTTSIDLKIDKVDLKVANDTVNMCFDPTNGFVTLEVDNNTGDVYSYEWTPKTYIVSGDGTDAPIAKPPFTTDFYLKAYLGECTVYDTMHIFVDKVQIHEIIYNVTCKGEGDGRIILSPSDYYYNWIDGFTGSYRNKLAPGRYDVSISSDLGCVRDTFYTITEPLRLYSNTKISPVRCKEICNGSIILEVAGGTPPYSLIWNNSRTNDTLLGLCPGMYKVNITDSNSCKINDSARIYIKDQYPYVNAYSDPAMVYLGQSATLFATDSTPDSSYTYVWLPEIYIEDAYAPITKVSPEQPITYSVFVTDNYGCMSKGEVTIPVTEFVCDDPFIYIPNAFSPNDDGVNDETGVFSNVLTEVYFAIYDRWGEMVFETNTTDKKWDGTYNGDKLPPGVFVYYIKATCVNNQDYIKKGNITLIR